MRIQRRYITPLLVIVVLISIVTVFVGCAQPDKSNRLNELLTLLPAEEGFTMHLITLSDFSSALESVDISLAELDEEAVTIQEIFDLLSENSETLAPISRLPNAFVTGWGQYVVEGLICDENVGYSLTSLDAEIQAGPPPNEMVAAIGRYNPKDTRDALQNQEEWPAWAVEAYTTEEYRGVTIHSWGDGYKIHMTDILVAPHIDMLGRAAPMAISDGHLFSCFSLEYVKAMIDASQDKVKSLADLPEYAEIVEKLSELGVYSVMMGEEFLVNGNPDEYDSYLGPHLKKFITFGTAPGKDEQGAFAAVVLYHENPDDARENISLLKRRIAETDSLKGEVPWTEIITSTDMEVEENLLIVKLYTDSVSLWANIVYSLLLLHEQ